MEISTLKHHASGGTQRHNASNCIILAMLFVGLQAGSFTFKAVDNTA